MSRRGYYGNDVWVGAATNMAAASSLVDRLAHAVRDVAGHDVAVAVRLSPEGAVVIALGEHTDVDVVRTAAAAVPEVAYEATYLDIKDGNGWRQSSWGMDGNLPTMKLPAWV